MVKNWIHAIIVLEDRWIWSDVKNNCMKILGKICFLWILSSMQILFASVIHCVAHRAGKKLLLMDILYFASCYLLHLNLSVHFSNYRVIQTSLQKSANNIPFETVCRGGRCSLAYFKAKCFHYVTPTGTLSYIGLLFIICLGLGIGLVCKLHWTVTNMFN